MSSFAERLAQVRERIDRALRQAGRAAGDTRLVAVSKTMPADSVRMAYAAGQRDFGENYVQEFIAKQAELADLSDIRWHFIGHLQSNKARHVAATVSLVHSVHSSALAQELGQRRALADQLGQRRALADQLGQRRALADQLDQRRAQAVPNTEPLPVLIEVNIGREPQKSGCLPEAVEQVAAAIDAEPALRLCGLMTVPPHTDTPDAARPHFEALAELRETLGGAERLPELSMGMSANLEHAVLAGATLVRVGTSLFGPRVYR